MANTANLAIYQGDDYAAVVAISNGGGTLDLTGYAAQAQIRTDYADQGGTVAAEIQITPDWPALTLALDIPHDVTATLAGNYVWDLQIVAPDGAITTILAGEVSVTQEVTREPA